MTQPNARPLYVQVADAIEKWIRSGALRPGEKLPSVRRAAQQHDVSINTIVEAYLVLENRGLIEGRPKSGFFTKPATTARLHDNRPNRGRGRVVMVGSLQSRLFDAARMPDVIPFGAAYPGNELLPVEKLARLTASVLRRAPDLSVSYDMPPGNDELRRQIARRSIETGITLQPDDILTTSGGTEALALAIRAVTKPGDTVAVESPTYFGILQLLQDLGLRALEIPMNPESGLDLAFLERSLKRQRVVACLAVPSFSNPLGALMPDEHKEKLCGLLRRSEVPLIEDDINGDLGHSGARPRVARSFDRDGWVMLCSSFSKTLAPGFRVGWIAPGRFAERIRALKLTSTLATASLPQQAIAEFLANGGYDHHLRALRATLAAQIARGQELIQQHFPTGTKVSHPSGGFVLWVEMPHGITALELHERALREGISIAPGPMFSATQQFSNCLRLNCGHPWTDAAERAIGRLGELASSGQ